VQGGVKAAEDGTLTVMAGGDRAAFERVKPVLEAVGKLVVHVGGPGCGQLTKLAHQMIVAVTLQGIVESFALGKVFGADQAAMREVLLAGYAAGPLMKNNAARIVSGDFTPGRPLWVYEKDRTALADTLDGTSLDLPLAHEVFERINSLIANGQSELDETALYTLLISESAPLARAVSS
jgi:2-hydroxy-3-oxopropionate reductase